MPNKPSQDELFDRLFKLVLLPSESPQQLKSLRAAVYEELAPRTVIEHFIARESVLAMHDTERHHRFRTGVLRNAFLPALQNLMEPACEFGGVLTDPMALQYFDSAEARKYVEEKLARLGLTPADVEAEAFRIRAEPLESINKQLASDESRLRALLRSLQEYRVRFPHSTTDNERAGAQTEARSRSNGEERE